MSKEIKRLMMASVLVFLLVLGACSDDDIVYNLIEGTEYVPDELTETEDEPREPVQFCGLADPDEAGTISNEEALSYLVLVNRCYRVSSEFSPEDLSPINVESVRILEGSHHLLRESAARAVEELFQAAEEDGVILVASSGYRSYAWQTHFHTNAVANHGLEEGRRISAVPGHSEHQLGLALDLSTRELDGALVQAFTSTPEGIWVNQNAHRFGFIISYPEGREEDTGFIYEPWHIRFVGVEAATEIFNAGQILEEFSWYND